MSKIYVNESTLKVLVSRDSAGNSKLCSTCCSAQTNCECIINVNESFCFDSSALSYTPTWLVVIFSGVKDCDGNPFPFLNDVPICLFFSVGNDRWFTNTNLGGGNISIFYETNLASGRSRLFARKTLEGIFCDLVSGDPCATSFTNRLNCAAGSPCSVSFDGGYIGKEGTATIFNLCDWDNEKNYIVGDITVHGEVIYTCNQNHINQEPPNASYWDVV